MLLESTNHTSSIPPSESLSCLQELTKCLTMELAVHLGKEVAAILRAVLTHETKKLYDDSTVHLRAPTTGSSRFTRNYFTHRPTAMPPGNVKENDLVVAWHGLQRMLNHPNSRGWLLARALEIGGIFEADTLQVWFSTHWVPVVL